MRKYLNNYFIIVITIGMIIVAGAIGVYNKLNYTNISSQTDFFDNAQVGLLPSELMVGVAEESPQELDNSNYILRVKASKDVDYFANGSQQEVEVLTVFKGNNINAGDFIIIATISRRYVFYNNSFNFDFVNNMIAGNEYLVFLDEKLDCKDVKGTESNVYITNNDFLIAPVFSYNDVENKVVELEDEFSTYVSLNNVKIMSFLYVLKRGIIKCLY